MSVECMTCGDTGRMYVCADSDDDIYMSCDECDYSYNEKMKELSKFRKKVKAQEKQIKEQEKEIKEQEKEIKDLKEHLEYTLNLVYQYRGPRSNGSSSDASMEYGMLEQGHKSFFDHSKTYWYYRSLLTPIFEEIGEMAEMRS